MVTGPCSGAPLFLILLAGVMFRFCGSFSTHLLRGGKQYAGPGKPRGQWEKYWRPAISKAWVINTTQPLFCRRRLVFQDDHVHSTDYFGKKCEIERSSAAVISYLTPPPLFVGCLFCVCPLCFCFVVVERDHCRLMGPSDLALFSQVRSDWSS